MARPAAVNWVSGWALWRTPARVLSYVLLVEATTVAVVAATSMHVHVSDAELVRFAILVGCALLNVELTLGVERVRDVTAGSGPVMHVDSVWWIAALLTLPPALTAALMTIIYTWLWLRVWRRRRPLHRWVFSVATIVLGTYAGAAVLAADPQVFPGVPATPVALGLAVLAVALRFLINFSLVFAAITLSTPNLPSTQLADSLNERVVEVGAAALGIMTAVILVDYPILMVFVVAVAATLHRGILVAQFRKAARVDARTGLVMADWWHEIANNAFQRGQAAGSADAGLAVLMLGLDHFKRVNDTYGHLAGDQVLQAVAQAINSEIRDGDTAGRWGGEEFVVLVPAIDHANLHALAERIRRRVHALVIPVVVADSEAMTVQDLTVSIGGARHPHPGVTGIDDLLLAADAALYRAKRSGRDQVVMANTQ